MVKVRIKSVSREPAFDCDSLEALVTAFGSASEITIDVRHPFDRSHPILFRVVCEEVDGPGVAGGGTK
jgi:hypothetical protein